MRVMLIDNYDSFTYNLFQLLARGERRASRSWCATTSSSLGRSCAALDFDNVVISPGPGRPERARDFGVCAERSATASVPVLGVCLGHQGLVPVARRRRSGTRRSRCTGALSRVHHDGSDLFAGIPRAFEAVRYHSLAVEPLPGALRGTRGPTTAS